MRDRSVEKREDKTAAWEMRKFHERIKGEKGTCMYMWKHKQKCIYNCNVCMHACKCIRACTSTCVCTHVYMQCMFKCVYKYTHTIHPPVTLNLVGNISAG